MAKSSKSPVDAVVEAVLKIADERPWTYGETMFEVIARYAKPMTAKGVAAVFQKHHLEIQDRLPFKMIYRPSEGYQASGRGKFGRAAALPMGVTSKRTVGKATHYKKADVSFYFDMGRDAGRGKASGRAKKPPVMSSDPFRAFVIPLSRAQSDFIATEILERYTDEMEDRGDFIMAAHLVKEEFLRSGGKNLVAAPFVKEMLIDFSDGLEMSIMKKRTMNEHGLNGQQAVAMQRTAMSLINKLPSCR